MSKTNRKGLDLVCFTCTHVMNDMCSCILPSTGPSAKKRKMTQKPRQNLHRQVLESETVRFQKIENKVLKISKGCISCILL